MRSCPHRSSTPSQTVLSGAGYHSFEKVNFRCVDDVTEADYAVLAKGDTSSWQALRGSFRYSYGDAVDVVPTEPFHCVLGFFAVCEDMYRQALFDELAAARNRLEGELHCKLLACVFFAEPHPDEYEELYYGLHDDHGPLVLQDDIDAHNLLVFRGMRRLM